MMRCRMRQGQRVEQMLHVSCARSFVHQEVASSSCESSAAMKPDFCLQTYTV